MKERRGREDNPQAQQLPTSSRPALARNRVAWQLNLLNRACRWLHRTGFAFGGADGRLEPNSTKPKRRPILALPYRYSRPDFPPDMGSDPDEGIDGTRQVHLP